MKSTSSVLLEISVEEVLVGEVTPFWIHSVSTPRRTEQIEELQGIKSETPELSGSSTVILKMSPGAINCLHGLAPICSCHQVPLPVSFDPFC